MNSKASSCSILPVAGITGGSVRLEGCVTLGLASLRMELYWLGGPSVTAEYAFTITDCLWRL